MRHTTSTPPDRRRRALQAVAVASALALALAGCSDDEPVEETGGMSILFNITGRGDTHPDGKGPLRLEDSDRIAQIAEAAGQQVWWSTRYRFPVDVKAADGTPWQVDGLFGGDLTHGGLLGPEPAAAAVDFSGSVTLLVPDLATDGDPTELTFDVADTAAEDLADEEDAKDNSAPATLYLNEAAFTELVEKAGRVTWGDAARTTGKGGPAEPKVVVIWGEFPPPRDSDAQRALWLTLESEGFFLPFLS